MKIDKTVGNVSIKLDTKRIDRNMRDAQIKLNAQVVADCDPYIPFRQGGLAGSVEYPKGIAGGEIMYNTPYAHYVYRAEIYGPNIPIYDAEGNLTGFWSPKNKRPTGREMKFSKKKHPQATKEFFEAAKRDHGKDWIDLVKRTAGKE